MKDKYKSLRRIHQVQELAISKKSPTHKTTHVISTTPIIFRMMF